MLNLQGIEGEHALICKHSINIAIDNGDFAEISDIASGNSISKINSKNGSKLLLKKGTIYDFFGNCFILGDFTKLSLYNEDEYFVKKEEVDEKYNGLLEIYNEISMTICNKENDKLAEFLEKKLFLLNENESKLIELNNSNDRIDNGENINKNNAYLNESIDKDKIVDQENVNKPDLVKNINTSNDTHKTIQDNMINGPDIALEKEIEAVKDTALNSNENKKKKGNSSSSKKDLLNQVKMLFPHNLDGYHDKRNKSVNITEKIETLSSTANETYENNIDVNIQNGLKNKRNKNILDNILKSKTKRKIGQKEVDSLLDTNFLSKRNTRNLVRSKSKSKYLNEKKILNNIQILQNFRIYWNDKTINRDKIKKMIETYGGVLINEYEFDAKNCLVICDKNNEKFINSMKKNGINCYSKELIIEGLKKQDLDFEK